MEFAIHTQVQQGVRIGLSDPYLTTFPDSLLTLRADWGNARGVTVQLSRFEVERLRGMLDAFLRGE